MTTAAEYPFGDTRPLSLRIVKKEQREGTAGIARHRYIFLLLNYFSNSKSLSTQVLLM